MTIKAFELEWEGYSPAGGVFGHKVQVLASTEEEARRELVHEMLNWGSQVRRVLSVRLVGTIPEIE